MGIGDDRFHISREEVTGRFARFLGIANADARNIELGADLRFDRGAIRLQHAVRAGADGAEAE